VAYDEGLAQRVREEMDELPGYVEKKMFGNDMRAHWPSPMRGRLLWPEGRCEAGWLSL